MTEVALPRSSPSVARGLPEPLGVVTHGLFVRDLSGDLLVGPVSLDLPPGTLTILTGATPAGRYALACALTGRLPLDRLRARGTVIVGGLSAPPSIRNATTLAQSWRVPDATTTIERRQLSLAWAATRHTGVVCLCPGLSGLTGADRLALLAAAAELRDRGVTLVVTAAGHDLTDAESTLADATINLDEHRW